MLRPVDTPEGRKCYEYAYLSKLTYNILWRFLWKLSRALSCWTSYLVISVRTNLCLILKRVVWTYHPLVPMTALYLLTGKKLMQRNLQQLKAENAARMSLSDGWQLPWTCLSWHGLVRNELSWILKWCMCLTNCVCFCFPVLADAFGVTISVK